MATTTAATGTNVLQFKRSRVNDTSRLFANKFLAVHPTVTLSIVDHHIRVAKDTNKRVVGILLGLVIDGQTHATNSFALPFEEDIRDPSIWYLDHHYLESMAYMFSKINRREKIVGWYSAGSGIKPADLEINELMRRYTPHPMYLLVNVQQSKSASSPELGAMGGTVGSGELPFKTYMAYDEPSSDKLFRRSFAHIACGVAQFEAEEVGVEHLLKDLENLSTSTRTTKIADKLNGLRCLETKLGDIVAYFQEVSDGKLPLNARILNNLQNLINLSPDTSNAALIEAFESETMTSMLATYIGTTVRTALALHDLMKNRFELKARSLKAEEQRQNKVQKEKEDSNKEREEKSTEQPEKESSSSSSSSSSTNKANNNKANNKPPSE